MSENGSRGRVDSPRLPASYTIADLLRPVARRILVVGGAARDLLLGIRPRDVDLEVYGVSIGEIEATLLRSGARVDAVGKAFGILKVQFEGEEADVSVPRRENRVGIGHRGFAVGLDESMTPEEAAARRDFTVNAMAIDAITGELLPLHGGVEDLRAGILRATSPAYSEDPLRVLRGLQLSSRLRLATFDTATIAMSAAMADEYHTIPIERIWQEWLKWATKSVAPSIGLRWIRETGWLRFYPELESIVGIPQDAEWHPEGDVWTHTALVCDAGAEIAMRESLIDDDRAVLVMASLCHDLAKATCTTFADGRIRSRGHEKAGAGPSLRLLERLGAPEAMVERVVRMVENHLFHITEVTERTVRRLSARAHPATVRDVVRLVEADHSGRPPLPKGLPESAARALRIAETLDVAAAKPKPIVMGRHLVELGYRPSAAFSPALAAAYEVQLDGGGFDESLAAAVASMQSGAVPGS